MRYKGNLPNLHVPVFHIVSGVRRFDSAPDSLYNGRAQTPPVPRSNLTGMARAWHFSGKKGGGTARLRETDKEHHIL
ncbi:MAG: hypothetical protein BWY09_03115 [Candidatus Hydrogenedentes bacterium ADurb.Bin179]|nr:MAG: hypothetical protein BWY09_03115 [Candidatus Hydrogenedentes bacterium ADurb.Bin179]